MTDLVERPGIGWAEVAPPDCEFCSLAWPIPGPGDRVTVATLMCGCRPGVGHRAYYCRACLHVTLVPAWDPLRCAQAGTAPPDHSAPINTSTLMDPDADPDHAQCPQTALCQRAV